MSIQIVFVDLLQLFLNVDDLDGTDFGSSQATCTMYIRDYIAYFYFIHIDKMLSGGPPVVSDKYDNRPCYRILKSFYQSP